MFSLFLRTIVPLLLLIAAGYLARKYKLLEAGAERTLASYVYYFALPALFLADLSAARFTPELGRFFLAGALPLLILTGLFLLAAPLFRLSRDRLARLIVSSVFGSTAFFGIPFIMFAFPGQEAERLAVTASAFISVPSLFLLVITLELWRGGLEVKRMGAKLFKNPLLLSILAGLLLAFWRIELPAFLLTFLQMLGRTTATMAIFMLGVFMYGREKIDLADAAPLSLLRLLVLPALALLVTGYLGLDGLARSVIVLMHAMPAALSLVVFADRYQFFPRQVSSLVVLSSLAAGLYLNLWLFWLVR